MRDSLWHQGSVLYHIYVVYLRGFRFESDSSYNLFTLMTQLYFRVKIWCLKIKSVVSSDEFSLWIRHGTHQSYNPVCHQIMSEPLRAMAYCFQHCRWMSGSEFGAKTSSSTLWSLSRGWWAARSTVFDINLNICYSTIEKWNQKVADGLRDHILTGAFGFFCPPRGPFWSAQMWALRQQTGTRMLLIPKSCSFLTDSAFTCM